MDIPTIETMREVLQKCPDCVLDLSEATEQEIRTEYSLLKKLGLLAENPILQNTTESEVKYGTNHSD